MASTTYHHHHHLPAQNRTQFLKADLLILLQYFNTSYIQQERMHVRVKTDKRNSKPHFSQKHKLLRHVLEQRHYHQTSAMLTIKQGSMLKTALYQQEINVNIRQFTLYSCVYTHTQTHKCTCVYIQYICLHIFSEYMSEKLKLYH